MSELLLDWTDRGATREVSVGDLVRVSLLQNGTTGYFWSAMPTQGDDPLEQIDGERGSGGESPAEPPSVLGTGIMREMVFRGRRPGTRPLVLRYWRGVEADDDVIYEVTVNVRDQWSGADDATAGGSS